MPPLPTEQTELMAMVHADVEATMLADLGVTVIYRPRDGSVDTEVKAYIGASRIARRPGGAVALGGGAGASTPALMRAQAANGRRMIVVKSAIPGEPEASGSGVGASGGIRRMQAGDTFKVAGFMVGRTDQASVTVTVADAPELVAGAIWRGDITL